MEIGELFNQALEAAKKNKKGLLRLKTAIVTLQQYELATKIREAEREAFPETEDVIAAKDRAKKVQGALAMVGLNVKPETAFLIDEAIKQYNEKGGEFSIDDATTIQFNHDEIFNIE